jgi:hypothetical protein
MITIDRDRGYLYISRCEYLYRDGLENRDDKANREMGDGDIVIPLPKHMCDRQWDDGQNGQTRLHGSDGQSAEIIIAEIRRRLGCIEDDQG